MYPAFTSETEIPVTETQISPERRVIGRMLSYWDELRGERGFPSRADIERDGTGELEPNFFLIAVRGSEIDDEVIESGPSFRAALSFDPVGKRVIDIMPSSTEKGLSFCRTAARLKKPIADVGSFTNASGEEILYRSIMLPLSDDQQTINYMLGAFSFKQVA
jgi:hypothetical protein